MTAPFGRRPLRVEQVRDVGGYRLLVLADPDSPEPRPGQFYMLAATERWGGGSDERPWLPRAFSQLRGSGGRLQFLLEDVGPGTERLAELGPGEECFVLGPLGVGFTAPPAGRRPLLVGGGIGIVPLAGWDDELGGATTLLGFRDADHAVAAELFAGARVATDDGSAGHHGFVTDLLAAELDRDPDAQVYACGPPQMLEAVRALTAARGTPAQLALEAGMACGYGACFGCAVPTRDGFIRLCLEGPVLDAASLDEVPV